jgi:hypothetical protein
LRGAERDEGEERKGKRERGACGLLEGKKGRRKEKEKRERVARRKKRKKREVRVRGERSGQSKERERMRRKGDKVGHVARSEWLREDKDILSSQSDDATWQREIVFYFNA